MLYLMDCPSNRHLVLFRKGNFRKGTECIWLVIVYGRKPGFLDTEKSNKIKPRASTKLFFSHSR